MKQVLALAAFLLAGFCTQAQVMHSLPASGGNIKSSISQRIGVTDMTIHWDAPGVKGREGKIWGTQIAHYGFQNLGFGTAKESPWRAGANENTTLEFGTDVMIEGKALEVFQLNYKKNGETWPTHVGLIRGYSATGDLKKALEHAKLAQKQAPDEVNRKSLEAAVKTLAEGKPL